jgi:cell wall-associated NlpC family hydrolase
VGTRLLMTAGVKRSATAVAAGLMASGMLISAGGSAGAAPKPTLSQVQSRLQALNTKALNLDQRYDQIQQELTSANQRLKLVNAESVRYQAKFKAERAQVAQIAALAYEDGNMTSVAALLTSGNAQTILNQSSILLQLSSDNNAQMSQFIEAAKNLTSAQQAAKRAQSAIAGLRAKLLKERKANDATIAAQKTLLAQLTPVQQAPTGPGSGTPPPPGGGVYKGPTGTQAEKAVAFAYAQLGKPYVFGGTGPNSYDCSGLTQAAWASAGISIERTSEDQWASLPHVSTSDLQPGDILVFAGASHVGIYVGGGMMIDAPHTGLDVEKVALSGWYSSELDGAVRP